MASSTGEQLSHKNVIAIMYLMSQKLTAVKCEIHKWENTYTGDSVWQYLQTVKSPSLYWRVPPFNPR